jgi:predicted secreted Zn-dependent protease
MNRRIVFCGWALLLCCPATHAEVIETFDLDTYEVDQESDQTLLQAINHVSPIKERGRIFHGYTRWYIKWNYRWWRETDGQCRITSVSVSLDVDMTLPELDEATPAVATEFHRYVSNLRLHEDGHQGIARKAAYRIDEGIRSLGPRENCDALGRAANELGHAILDETRGIERQYDVETNHGCTQGACL